MIEHNLNKDQDFIDFENQMTGMQYVQISKEQEQEEAKEAQIEARQPKTAEEMIEEAFKDNKQGLEHAQALYSKYIQNKIEDGDEKYQPKEIAQKAIKDANEILKYEEQEFNKWIKNAPYIYEVQENQYSKEQWLEEFRENEKSKPEQNYIIKNSENGEMAEKSIEIYEKAVENIQNRYLKLDSDEKLQIAIEATDKNKIQKIKEIISNEENLTTAIEKEMKSYNQILENKLQEEQQKNIKIANEEYQDIQKEAQEINNSQNETKEILEYFDKNYSYEKWAETPSAIRQDKNLTNGMSFEEIPNQETLQEWHEQIYFNNPPQEIIFDIEFANDDNNRKIAEEKMKEIYGKNLEIWEIDNNEQKADIIKNAINISSEIKQEIKKEKENNELNPQETKKVIEEAKNIYTSENIDNFKKAEERLKENQEEQEKLKQKQEEEIKKLYEKYGKGDEYKPNWTFYEDKNQEKEKENIQEQKNPYEHKLNEAEEVKEKEFAMELEKLEKAQKKERDKLKEEQEQIKQDMANSAMLIMNSEDFEGLLKNLKKLDIALQAIAKNEDEQAELLKEQRKERINLALQKSPATQKIISEMLKEQKEKEEKLEKEQKDLGLAEEQAKYISKKVDDMQNTNNLNAKQSFANDIEKVLKDLDKAKKLEEKQEKNKEINLTPKEQEQIKIMKMMEQHYPNTIKRAKENLDKFYKEQQKQKEKEQTKTQAFQGVAI